MAEPAFWKMSEPSTLRAGGLMAGYEPVARISTSIAGDHTAATSRGGIARERRGLVAAQRHDQYDRRGQRDL